jgi:hypothetical protein
MPNVTVTFVCGRSMTWPCAASGDLDGASLTGDVQYYRPDAGGGAGGILVLEDAFPDGPSLGG